MLKLEKLPLFVLENVDGLESLLNDVIVVSLVVVVEPQTVHVDKIVEKRLKILSRARNLVHRAK